VSNLIDSEKKQKQKQNPSNLDRASKSTFQVIKKNLGNRGPIVNNLMAAVGSPEN
jgi:hypothetical protein